MTKLHPDNFFNPFDRIDLTGNNTKYKSSMGISINLYRLGKAEKLDDITDLETQISKM